MKRTRRIIYWIATIWLALGMVSTGIVQLIKMDEEVQKMTQLGYPVYLLGLIGTLKLTGVVVVLIPGVPLLKEWTYAGFCFLMVGALFSHFAAGDAAGEYFGPCLLLVLTFVSWYFRPDNRKLAGVGPTLIN